MEYMFYSASVFNQPIGQWDVSKVTNMHYMFQSASVFNQPIGQWDVSKVTNMQYMFQSAPAFAQSLESWPETTSTLATNWYGPTHEMFNGATAFRSKFSCPSGNFGPPVSCICNEGRCLENANFRAALDACLFESPVAGNCDTYGTETTDFGLLSDWDVSRVTNMSFAFKGSEKFNGDLSKWQTTSATSMDEMFSGALSFTGSSLGEWDTSSVVSMSGMFEDAISFNQPLSLWDTSQVTDMSSMFLNATSFNQPLSLWDTSQVTDMSSMFESAVSFAQPVYFWTGSAATSSSGSTSIFASASSFLEKYSCDSAVDGPVNTCTCSNPVFCVSDAVFLSAVSACLAESPALGLCPTYGTMTTQFGASMSIWDTSLVTNMSHAFEQATSFNGDISSWNTVSVTSMSSMFFNASSFAGDILGWTGSATESAQVDMLFGASQFHRKYICSDTVRGPLSACVARVKLTDETFFDARTSCLNEEPLKGDCTTYGTVTNKYGVMSDWDVSLVTKMNSAFQSKTTFNGDISNWDVRSRHGYEPHVFPCELVYSRLK